MNFFEHQYKARRKTWLLVTYFVLAVVLIILAVNLAVFVAFYLTIGPETAAQITTFTTWFTGPYAIWISLATLAVIVIGTMITFIRLRGGGRAVAELVGARRVDTNTGDLAERRLINIVEEMSIASGTPVPELYVLEDPAINAFVAGYRPTETVLVVTRGGLDTFTRDELQGVIGHEYSHIFNGDMRINIRLMGVLAGILLIGQIGRFLLRSAGRSRGRSSKGSGQAAILGLALLIVGYIGLFFGSLIKAAISRQREFLADASSVQFTRNPDGIAGALWSIKENMESSILMNSHAEDISHFCFSDAIGSRFTSLMATHPPLDQRIKAINPHFDLKQRLKHRQEQDQAAAAQVKAAAGTSVPGVAAGFAGPAAAATVTNGALVRDSIGQMQAEHLHYAGKIHAAIPTQLSEAVHKQDTVTQLVYALVIADMHPTDQPAGLEILTKAGVIDGVATINIFIGLLQTAGPRFRLPLINMAIPTLKSLSWQQRAQFLVTLEDLIKADKRYTIFEFALLTILTEHLAEGAGADLKEKYFKFTEVMNEINLLLSVLARVGASTDEEAQSTYAAIIRHFTPAAVGMADKSECKLGAISLSLRKLNLLSSRLKQTVIESFADCVIHDGKVLPAEAELLQAIAISLDCPMPPLNV